MIKWYDELLQAIDTLKARVEQIVAEEVDAKNLSEVLDKDAPVTITTDLENNKVKLGLNIDENTLEKILKNTASVNENTDIVYVTKTDFYNDGLTGKPDSAQRRAKLIKKLSLPPKLSANGLLQLINQIGGLEVYKKAMEERS